MKPLAAVVTIHAGIPDFECPFWESKYLADIHSLYISLVATPDKVISIVQEPESMNSVEQRVFIYLTEFIGDMKQEELATFLRFVSGSCLCGKEDNHINSLGGKAPNSPYLRLHARTTCLIH